MLSRGCFELMSSTGDRLRHLTDSWIQAVLNGKHNGEESGVNTCLVVNRTGSQGGPESDRWVP